LYFPFPPSSILALAFSIVHRSSEDERRGLTPHSISGRMTVALAIYSGVFARYALAVTPKNYLLFGCHIVNATAQTAQGYRFLNYWK
jgi:hypothetical protein